MREIDRQRAIIIGMCNPSSADPDDALELRTPNASGERLWKMLDAVAPTSKEEFALAFERVNLSARRSFRLSTSRVRKIRRLVGKRTAVVLGRDVWRALWPGERAEWFQAKDNWHLIPHPSGRSLSYNDAAKRRRAGLLLARIAGREEC